MTTVRNRGGSFFNAYVSKQRRRKHQAIPHHLLLSDYWMCVSVTIVGIVKQGGERR